MQHSSPRSPTRPRKGGPSSCSPKRTIRGRDMKELNAKFIPFSAQTRMSGVEFGGTTIRKGAVDSILSFVNGGAPAASRAAVAFALKPGVSADAAREIQATAEAIAKSGGTPLAVARDGKLLGVIQLKDIVKGGIRERFSELRRMGIRTVMITGDNPMTAAAIAAEAGVDDFLAQATPENKLSLIREEQAKGKLVAMCGDGTPSRATASGVPPALAISSAVACSSLMTSLLVRMATTALPETDVGPEVT